MALPFARISSADSGWEDECAQFDVNENGVVWVGTFGTAKAVVYSRILDENDESGS